MSSAVQIKSDPDDISEQILALCRDSPQGIGDKFLQNEMPNVDPKVRVKAINQVKIIRCSLLGSCNNNIFAHNIEIKKTFIKIFFSSIYCNDIFQYFQTRFQ